MKILLIGKYGQVAWELQRTLSPIGDVVAVGRSDVNLADVAAVRKLVGEIRPAVVVNAAACTAVDKAETETEHCHQINATLPGVLAEEAKKVDALFVHYSTDYVFDGTKTSPYVENDPTNPLGVYGASKLAGEEAVRAVGVDYLLFRLCWVYGARGQNFMLTMLRLAREREKLRVVRDQVGCPTWSRMIAEVTAQAVRQVLASHDRAIYSGIYDLAASGHTNWHGFASRIVELMPEAERKCREIEAITTAEYPTPAKRPAYSVLNCDKLAKTFGLRLPDWEFSLRQVLDKP